MGRWEPSRLVTFVVSLPTPWLIAWLGLTALSIALIVLMRTRWGQSQPLRKCVVLSLLAHALFGCFATTVKIVSDTAGMPESEPIYVALADDGAQPLEPAAASSTKQAAWDMSPKFVVPPLGGQRLPLMQPPEGGTTNESDRAPLDAPEDVPTDLATQRTSPEPTAEPDVAAAIQAALPERTESSRAAEAIEAPAPEQREAEDLAMPLVERERPGLDDEPPLTASRAAEESMPAPQIDPLDLAPQISDLERIESPAEALAARDDFLKQLTSSASSDQPANPPEDEAAESQTSSGSPAKPGAALVAVDKQRTAHAETHTGGSLAEAGPSLATLARQRRPAHILPPVYEHRVQSDRLAIATRRGGGPETEAAVEAALKWLADNQHADGRWDADQHGAGREQQVLGHDRQGAGVKADTAVSGLAILAFLGAGYTHDEGPYQKAVGRGLEYLMSEQGADGNLAGRATLFAKMYCHGMAALALCEAYAMTGDARLEPAVRRAIGFTLTAQDPTTGGWRYQPGDTGDMSQHGWQVMTLKSAELAGIPLSPTTRSRAIEFIDSVTTGNDGGLARYRQGQAATRPMTAEALFCRQLLGVERGPAASAEAARFILEERPGAGQDNFYYWYYATLAMYQTQGDAWEQWNAALKSRLLATQRDSGQLTGSWNPTTVWGGYGGRVYTTSMAALSLEVYYRYLPLYSIAARPER